MRRSSAPSLKKESIKRLKLDGQNSPSTIANRFGIDLSPSSQSSTSTDAGSPCAKNEGLVGEYSKRQGNTPSVNEDETLDSEFSLTSSSGELCENPLENCEHEQERVAGLFSQNPQHNPHPQSSFLTSKSCVGSTNSKRFKPPLKSLSQSKPQINEELPNTNSSSNDISICNIGKEKKKFLPPSQSVPIEKPSNQQDDVANLEEHYYSVVWCKASNKKHKKWDGDGVLVTKGKTAFLKDEEGKIISKGSGYKSADLINLLDGNTLIVGGKEIEVQGSIDREKYLSGQCFFKSNQSSVSSPPKLIVPFKSFVPHKSSFGNEVKKSLAVITPRHNPANPNALVMQRPSKETIKQVGNDKPIIDVVIDPFISHYLRPHQKEGVRFLYNGVMGFNETSGNGVILADEMGLGKTLQCIALVWTLLKQGPYNGKPVIKKCVIVTPGSLVKNWCKEFSKWLGSERLIPFGIDQKKRVDEYLLNMHSPVMVISYEMFLRCIEDIRKAKFDLIICDEAHRLKNSAIKTASAISSLFIAKRVLLTGTPIQNNLQEFYTLADMANPGVLGTLNAFRKVFIEPITESQQPRSDADVKELGSLRAKELTRLTSSFCLRRTADINKNYLPRKVEHVIFTQMSSLQLKLYQHILKSNSVRSCLTYSDSVSSKHLICIGALKKVCNDPELIYRKVVLEKENANDEDTIYCNIASLFPCDYPKDSAHASGKLKVLKSLLQSFKVDKQKAVLVSNSTKMLDILERFCDENDYTKVRLDGQTNVATRQQIVDRFNDRHSNISVFLLSSKAGGVGLNLTGASNLILYDIDWNPANDLQAMARVWRDGQKNEVNIYRLLITSSIEEKIYQRQIIKQGLSGAVVDSLAANDKTEFSAKDLKDLLTYKATDTCITHELLQCYCHTENDEKVEKQNNQSLSTFSDKKSVSMAQLMKWEHIKNICSDEKLGCRLKDCDGVSFIFRNVNS